MADELVMHAIDRGNAVVFFDLNLGDGGGSNGGGGEDNNNNTTTIEPNLGRIKMELFVRDCPKTCENFRQFCTGEYLQYEQPTGYKHSTFHRVIKGFVLQGGDFVNHDGTGKLCIYGGNPTFADENLTQYKHDQPGMISMANSGPDSNGCQFFITCAPAPHLDGKHTVFGRVLPHDDESMLTVRKCEAVPVNGTTPRLPLTIVQCGEL